ncbi:Pyridoxal phosphate homeostasis protein [Petrocella atlantisensis]|uniref:Pyridoxal phosphate homeostasis protein n=1 Tax=Petrocella atlantisensis TaxID=2173034 RepID=A0A3P7P6J9_9FIRM|nr:YggS family pyridoxal phosphate-dependent enzyme [Petrocella atlantisensis]PKM54511.1 MAG: YggS family pyridoxal phosphate-dependent enzyme [Firmicutes bacterium HGW-Firmicutes-5]VDN45973.1 Pyridoxal phosphate homeostasis protein [Petrocella atlantisensis]
MIQENLNNIKKQITDICLNIDRDPKSVVLVNVSKTKPISILEEGYEAGMRIFGENKVQEICDKYEQFKKEDIKWHMIGHLQRNKVKYIVDKVDLIHSVDSYRLAEAISKEAKKKNVVAHILIQVNVAQEESKYGLETKDVMDMVRSIHQLEHLKIEGLMTIAPFVDDPEENRPIFKALYQLSVDIKEQNLDNVSMDVLSMGMTNDFKVAIEEGATMIRIGTALFGDRNY